LVSSVAVPVFPEQACAIDSARAASQMRSALRSASSFFLKSGSNQRPAYSPALAAKRAWTS